LKNSLTGRDTVSRSMKPIDAQAESFFQGLGRKGPAAAAQIKSFAEAVASKSGAQAAYNLLLRSEVIAGWRKPSLAIYDHTLHLIGGGEKYGCTMAAALQDEFDITLIAHRPVTLADLMEWYDLDLSRCRVKIMPLAFFEMKDQGQINPDLVSDRSDNPFLAVSRESGNYDFFINNSMLEMVYPLSNISLFICHFPERQRGAYFYVQHYRHLIYNSRYTAEWIDKKWRLSPGQHIYPPVDMEADAAEKLPKENIILSVARFESGGSKQQAEMISAFQRLRAKAAPDLRGWKLILCGGSASPNPYLEKIRGLLNARPDLPVELQVNIPLGELKKLYARASLFWHFCGLNQSNPANVEHFGMSTVEAMQNQCLPMVFDGGGQREIVENGISGYRFSSIGQLLDLTLKMIRDPGQRELTGRAAQLRGGDFTRAIFAGKVRGLFRNLAEEYTSGAPLAAPAQR
jgi:glycosyltransferase involved in cell wall biosynthesis